MPTSSSPGRLPVIDLLRGLALLAMALYHFSWDLRFLGFVDWDLVGDAGWTVKAYRGWLLRSLGAALA